MSCTERVIVLVDMDCFYCQVEEKLDPSLEGKPIAVVQYNAWRGGGIIAVNYPAREKGVTRHMRGNDAKQKCPEIVLVRVPEVRGKADLTKYREAGKRVADVLQIFTPILERASVDEAYLDITDVVQKKITEFSEVQLNNLQNTYVVGYDIQDFLYNVNKNRDYSESNYRLTLGGVIVEQIRAEVYKKTGYKCSAGIAHNKILAKLVCGLHKPNKQTILPQESVPKLYKELPLKKVPGLGGKFGISISDKLNISKIGELVTFSEKHLVKYFDEKTAKWLYNIARGIDYEAVTTRLISKSIGCCKKFPGRSALTTAESIDHWVNEFVSEILERLEGDLKENNRRARQITLHFTQTVNGKQISSSRTLSLNCYDHSKMTQICLDAIKRYCMKSDGTYDIRYLGFSVGNFELNKKTGNISSFFENMRNFNLQKSAISENSVKQESDWLKQNIANTELSPNIVIETVGVIPNQHEDLILEKKKYLNEDNTSPSEEQISFSGNDEIHDQTYQDNTSIYSAETDDLNDDIKSLIFYEDIYPESVATEPIFTKPLSENKRKINDTILKNSCHTDSFSQGSSSSFFSKYFENYNIDNCYSSPTERDFDTSKILTQELEDSDEIKSHESIQIAEDKIEEKNIKSQIEFDEWENKKLSGSDICPECRKNIPKSEFGSHMDYHYALNIVKEEAHLYKPTQSSTSKQASLKNRSFKNLSKPAIKKRTADTKPILAYLQTDELNEENSELCTECNKRIKLDDVINHMDYHTAKKIHLEINATSSFAPTRKNVEKIHVKRKKKKVKSRGTITSFLNHGNI
ncbi:N-acetyltransferase eso1 [Anoplophora glabripennis]|uniref:N-acetyltransferase eso1 n=1 Tax=Anoplophora glabripennis TaxID=217634 RepID=UPI000873FF38|nr:N-acetyltransferase eso1 [Anoplophora glabripennis]